MTDKKINEGLAELAGVAEADHEVQMARAELYKIAKYAIKLHELLKNVSEAEGIEAWQQSKITKAADYIGSVYHALEYDMRVLTPIAAEGKTMSRAAKGNEKYGNDKVDEVSSEKKAAYGKAAFADYHKQSKAKLGKILSGDKNTDDNSRKMANRLKGISRSTKTESADAYKLQLAQQLDEKAKSKAQQKFMGMVHAAQKGEKPASKEVAKVAKDMPKKAAKDYAATKHKGKPEHVKKK